MTSERHQACVLHRIGVHNWIQHILVLRSATLINVSGEEGFLMQGPGGQTRVSTEEMVLLLSLLRPRSHSHGSSN